MDFLLQILFELITGVIPWRRKQDSLLGESRLDREAKRFGQGVLVLAMLILLGLLAWFCFLKRNSDQGRKSLASFAAILCR
jgi:hypothetical protein